MKLFWMLFFLFTNLLATAQDTTQTKTGFIVITSEEDYVRSITNKPLLAMVDIKKVIPEIKIELPYNTSNNFTGKKIYRSANTTFLRKKAAVALAAVQKELTKKGLGLRIFDAYRPYSATQLIWELVKDERYAASPLKGSNHNRGVAVDVTIINMKTKEEVDMGTGFDNFSDTAHQDFTQLPGTVLQNRSFLKRTMERNGFKNLPTEWWHYALPNAKDYEVLDLDFDQLERITAK